MYGGLTWERCRREGKVKKTARRKKYRVNPIHTRLGITGTTSRQKKAGFPRARKGEVSIILAVSRKREKPGLGEEAVWRSGCNFGLFDAARGEILLQSDEKKKRPR